MFGNFMNKTKTIGELKASKYQIISIKDELRRNVISKLEKGEPLFPRIIGYEKTVIPALVNAILARHDILLLGTRGQAKSRLVRTLPNLLDEFIPVIKGCEINDNPYHPVCKRCMDLVKEYADQVEIEWLHRDQRFGEKLATPDVTIADLIGDIDPIKAATQRLHYAHEGAIHFGIVPRTNRGIFAINELPDLQPRIQVGLLNILEEKDIQIRGFNVRIPLDMMIVCTANPEDYTNRGNLITPLKDRIDSQIMTHYAKSMEDSIAITEQEAWVHRNGRDMYVPRYFQEIIEQIGFEARASEYIDQKSGVSARLTISAMENLISNAERRAILHREPVIIPRLCDLQATLPAITGKVELVFEGEQEGAVKVGKALIGKAVRTIFQSYFPDPLLKKTKDPQGSNPVNEYDPIIRWFGQNRIEIADDMPANDYFAQLQRVKGLKGVVESYITDAKAHPQILGSSMEFVLEGLHQCSKIAKDEVGHETVYKDFVGSIFQGQSEFNEEE
jgi:magnesium chelatase subunit I